MARALATGLLVALIGGCGWLRDDKGVFVDRRDDYLNADENPDLVVPGDFGVEQLGDPFPIPPTPEQNNPEFFPYRPPLPDAIYGDDSAETVRIQRLGERRWLVVPELPATLWPKVKQFFAENGVAVAAESPEAGRIDTEWLLLENRGYRDIVRTLLLEARDESSVPATETAERLILRVEQGIRDRTAEVHLRHQRVLPDRVAAAGPSPLDIGPVRSDDQGSESELLAELGAYVAAKVSEQSFSMVGQSITTQPKAILQRLDTGSPALRLNLDEERAWATVGQALTNAEIDIEASDAESLEYEISLKEEDLTGEKPGFFARTFSFGDRAERLKLRLLPIPDATGFYAVVERPDREIDREFAQSVLVLVREYAG
ncbi:MAG: outer membrane protein assembly factor BamC [Pseudomonadota bacterium]